MKSYNDLLDPTIPNKAEFVAGGKHAGLEDDLDNLVRGLTGAPEKQRGQFHDRILALAKKRDLLFADVHSLALARHPEWRQSETLFPTPFLPGLMTRTERAQGEREMDQKRQEQKRQEVASSVVMTRVAAILASDPSRLFGDVHEQVMTELPSLRNYGDVSSPAKVNPPLPTLKRNPPPPVMRAQAVSGCRMTRIHCEEDRANEVYLVEGAFCNPLF
jgi:hypothetical protein